MLKKKRFQIRSEAAKKRWQRDKDKEEYWRVQLDAWKASGLSVRKFCLVHSITESSFRAWSRELALRDRERARPSSAIPPSNSESPFVAIRLVPDQPELPEAPVTSTGCDVPSLQIQMPGGASLLVTDTTDFSLVAKLISALEVR